MGMCNHNSMSFRWAGPSPCSNRNVVKNFPREFLQMLAAPSLCFNVSEWLGCLDSSVTLSFQISPLCQGAGGWSLCKS